MILLDTTVLVYAVGSDHPLQSPCRQLIALLRDAEVRATTTVEVIQEFAHVRARRRPRDDAAHLALSYARGLAPLVGPDEDDLAEGLDLFRRSDRLGPFDAVLAATARRRGWALASADRSFGAVTDLTYLDPSSPRFLQDSRSSG